MQMKSITWMNRFMSSLDRHQRISRLFMRPLANAPLLSRRLPVLARATMGSTAFEVHEVDLPKGRISIGGVDEIMFSSKFLELFHDILGERMGRAEKNRALYDVGHRGGHWEIQEAVRHGRWAPRSLAELIGRPDTLSKLRSEPELATFFTLSMKVALRLVINEGGWGSPTMDLSSEPIRVRLANSQEARWAGPSDEPVCYLSAGVIAGYSTGLLGAHLDAKEVRCAAMGHPDCLFELSGKD